MIHRQSEFLDLVSFGFRQADGCIGQGSDSAAARAADQHHLHAQPPGGPGGFLNIRGIARRTQGYQRVPFPALAKNLLGKQQRRIRIVAESRHQRCL